MKGRIKVGPGFRVRLVTMVASYTRPERSTIFLGKSALHNS